MNGYEFLEKLAKVKKVNLKEHTDYKFTCNVGAKYAELQFGDVQRWPNWAVYQKTEVYRFKVEKLEEKYHILPESFDSNVADQQNGWHNYDYARQVEVMEYMNPDLDKIKITNWKKIWNWWLLKNRTDVRYFLSIDFVKNYGQYDEIGDFMDYWIQAKINEHVTNFREEPYEIYIKEEDLEGNVIDIISVDVEIERDNTIQKKEAELIQQKKIELEVMQSKHVGKAYERKYVGTFVYDTIEYMYAIFAGKTATAVTLSSRFNSIFQANKTDWSKATKHKVLRFKSSTPEEVKAYLETEEGQMDVAFNAYE